MNRLKSAFKRYSGRFAKKPRVRTCTLGDENGVVEVPGHPNMVWVREHGRGARFPVYNFLSARTKGLWVKVGEDELNPGVQQVLGLSLYPGAVYGDGALVGKHGSTHMRGGSDQIYIDLRQIINVLPFPAGGLNVKVYPGYALNGDGSKIIRISETTIDLSSYAPVSGAKYVLLSNDDTGAVTVTDGTGVNFADLDLDDAPDVPDGHSPIAWVRLYAGQTSISDAFSNSDIIDPRYVMRLFEYILHAGKHEAGGADEIDVTNLSGKLADMQDAGWIQGKPVPEPASGDDQKALIYDLASDEFIYGEAGGGGGSGASDFSWHIEGALAAASNVGATYTSPRVQTIEKIIFFLKDTGSAGSSVFDVNLDGVSIFSANPTIAYDDADQMITVIPDTVAVPEDSNLTLDIDSVATGASGLDVLVVFAGAGSVTRRIYAAEVLLDQTAPSGGQASFDVDNIPSGYAKIEIEIHGRTEAATDLEAVNIAFNNDTTSSNYRRILFYGQHTPETVQAVSDDSRVGLYVGGSNSGSYASSKTTILDPSGVMQKTMMGRATARRGSTLSYNSLIGNIWESTDPITRITIAPGSGADFAEGTRCVITGWKEIEVSADNETPATYAYEVDNDQISVSTSEQTICSTSIADAPPGVYFITARTWVWTVQNGVIRIRVNGSSVVSSDPRTDVGERVLSYLYEHTEDGDIDISLTAITESGTAVFGQGTDARFGARIAAFRIGALA